MAPTSGNVLIRRSWRTRQCFVCARNLRAGARVVCEVVPSVYQDRDDPLTAYELEDSCPACAAELGLVRPMLTGKGLLCWTVGYQLRVLVRDVRLARPWERSFWRFRRPMLVAELRQHARSFREAFRLLAL